MLKTKNFLSQANKQIKSDKSVCSTSIVTIANDLDIIAGLILFVSSVINATKKDKFFFKTERCKSLYENPLLESDVIFTF